MAYDTTEAVAKFLSGFQMKITKRERDTVAPDYYVKYLLTLSKGGKDFSTTFVSDPRAFGEPTVTQVFSALADDALTLRKYSTDEFVDKLYAQGVKPSAALRAYDSCKETLTSGTCATRWRILISTVTSPTRSVKLPIIRSMTTIMPFSRGFQTTRSGWNKPSSTAFSKAARAISTRWFRWRSTSASSPTSTTIARISPVTAPSTS